MPKIVDHQQKREEILEGSFTLFARRGYSSVTMREIAKELGVSTGTLYHYFPNKEKLFTQIVETLTQRDVFAASEQINTKSNFSEKLECLLQYVKSHEEQLENLLLLTIDFTKQNKNMDSRETIIRSIQQYTQTLQEIFDLENPNAGSALCSMLIGVICQRILAKDSISFENVIQLVQQLTKNPTISVHQPT